MNFTKFLKTPFLQNTSRRLLLTLLNLTSRSDPGTYRLMMQRSSSTAMSINSDLNDTDEDTYRSVIPHDGAPDAFDNSYVNGNSLMTEIMEAEGQSNLVSLTCILKQITRDRGSRSQIFFKAGVPKNVHHILRKTHVLESLLCRLLCVCFFLAGQASIFPFLI